MTNARAKGGIMNTDTNRIKSSLSNIFSFSFLSVSLLYHKGVEVVNYFVKNFLDFVIFYLFLKTKILGIVEFI